MLTDKAKEKFEKWYNTSTSKFILDDIDVDDLPLVCQQALIVEWLDSEGIGVDAYTGLSQGKLYWNADIIAVFDIEKDSATTNLHLEAKSRPESLTKAIEKANEILNSKL